MNKTADLVAYRRAYYLANKNKINKASREYRANNKNRLAEIDRAYREANPRKAMWLSAKARAQKKNIPFEITEDDIYIPEVCPILGTPFEYGTKFAMSLDRRHNDKGYVPGNVWVISRQANSMKNDASDEMLRKFAQWVVWNV